MARQVKCINKKEHHNPYERITHIGGDWGKISSDQAIQDIKADPHSYYVSVGNSVWVVVATKNGREYLKTANDGENPNNLLSLPECK